MIVFFQKLLTLGALAIMNVLLPNKVIYQLLRHISEMTENQFLEVFCHLFL